MNIEQRLKDLRLLPLFPDMNFNYGFFDLQETGEIITITDLREEANLRFTISLFYDEKSTNGYIVLGRVYNYENGEDFLNISEQYPALKLVDGINKFNFNYEILASKFNELLIEKLKEELEKEKEKAKKEEKEKAKKEQKEKAKEEEQGGDEQGGDEQGGDEQGDNEQGGDEQGGDGKMSSKDIQNLIDQLNNQIDNKDTNGQSNDQAIDLEDFLNKVEEGKIDNDFTKYRNDAGLKAEIYYEKQPEPNGLEFLDDDVLDDFEPPIYNSVVKALKDKLILDESEIKRRFPTPDFVRDFVFLLSNKEINDLSERIGIEKETSLNEKKSIIASNLITELQNI